MKVKVGDAFSEIKYIYCIWVILIKTDPKLLYTLNPLSYNHFFNDLINVCTIM